MEAKTTVDDAEIRRFSQIASEWWDPNGKFKPLHKQNPVRIQFIRDQACAHFDRNPENPSPLSGLKLLDIGCGGGLISEPMARLGAEVTGIDASEKGLNVARAHAAAGGLSIDYYCMSAEELLAKGSGFRMRDSGSNPSSPESRILNPGPYDIVLALEIVEHVADVDAFVAASVGLLKPGGLIIYSTLNRTAKSFALAIVGAEYVLRWLPRGTHEWKKFLKPSELCHHLRRHGIEIRELTGMVMDPLRFTWSLAARDLSVNYLVSGRKAA